MILYEWYEYIYIYIYCLFQDAMSSTVFEVTHKNNELES